MYSRNGRKIYRLLFWYTTYAPIYFVLLVVLLVVPRAHGCATMSKTNHQKHMCAPILILTVLSTSYRLGTYRSGTGLSISYKKTFL